MIGGREDNTEGRVRQKGGGSNGGLEKERQHGWNWVERMKNKSNWGKTREGKRKIYLISIIETFWSNMKWENTKERANRDMWLVSRQSPVPDIQIAAQISDFSELENGLIFNENNRVSQSRSKETNGGKWESVQVVQPIEMTLSLSDIEKLRAPISCNCCANWKWRKQDTYCTSVAYRQNNLDPSWKWQTQQQKFSLIIWQRVISSTKAGNKFEDYWRHSTPRT